MVSEAYPVIENPNDTRSKEASAFDLGAKVQRQAVGSSGTDITAGYFSEEYLTTLRGTRAADIFDEMYRSESQVAMLMGAIMNPIKSATWEIEAHEQTTEFNRHADLVRACLFDMIDFDAFKHEALTLVRSGFSLFEVVHNVVFNHPKFGTFNGLASLGFRSQRTIERWQLEKKTGRILYVEQWTYDDVSEKTQVKIPGEFLLVFTNLKEGNNYEGISALRSMYGPYQRKQLYLKLAAIGMEKYAIGTPIGTVPAGKEKTPEFAMFKAILAGYTSHQSAYVTVAEGWKIEIQKSDFDASKLKDLILLENTEMINSVVANFLALGTNGGGGAYALGSDLSDFFLGGIQSYADLICGVINRQLIPNLVKLNYGAQDGYPKLKCSGINDKAGKELAEVIKTLKEGGALDPDQKLKEYVRKAYKMPKPVEPVPGVAPVATAPILAEERLQLDEKYRKDFDNKKEQLKEVMQTNLTSMLAKLKETLRKKYNAASPSDKIKTAIGVEVPGVNAYRSELKELLAQFASDGVASAKAQLPRRLRLTEEQYDSYRLAGPSFFEKLPPKIRKGVEAQASLIADTQAADLGKVTFFQFTSSATGTEDIDAILNDVQNSAQSVIEGSTASGMSVDAAASNAVANVLNQSRMEYFFAPDVLEEIESFTFENEDPVSEICKELNGTTFAVGDPDIDKYTGPLHHNCKSRMRPNMKGVKDNPEIDNGVSLTQKALNSMTLSEMPLYRIV